MQIIMRLEALLMTFEGLGACAGRFRWPWSAEAAQRTQEAENANKIGKVYFCVLLWNCKIVSFICATKTAHALIYHYCANNLFICSARDFAVVTTIIMLSY